MNSTCLFCQVRDKKIPANIVFENDQMIVFKDIYPQAKIHLLAIPKKHYQDMVEFSGDKTFGSFMEGVAHFAKNDLALKDGFRLVSNIGEIAGQSVFHVHFHLLSDEKLGRFGR